MAHRRYSDSSSSESNSSDSDPDVVVQNGGPEDEPEEIEIEREVGRDYSPVQSSDSEEEMPPRPDPRKKTLVLKMPAREDKFEKLDEKDIDEERMIAFWSNYSAHCLRERYTDERKISILGRKLSGDSLMLYNSYVSLNLSYDDLTKRILEGRFGPQGKEDRKDRMKSVRFAGGGKKEAAVYWTKKESALRYFEPNMEEADRVDYLVAGAKGWARHADWKKEARRLKRERPNNLLEAIKAAFFDLAKEDKAKEQPTITMVNSFLGSCYACNEVGHRAADCPTASKTRYLPAARGSPFAVKTAKKFLGAKTAENKYYPQKSFTQKPKSSPSFQDKRKNEENYKKRKFDSVNGKCNNCDAEGHHFYQCPFQDTRRNEGKLVVKDEFNSE